MQMSLIRTISLYEQLACSFGYKLAFAGNKFSKPFLGKDSVYNLIDSMMEESKYCSEMIKKKCNKELVMTKEGNEWFKNYIKCWICDNYVDGDAKVIHHCQVTAKYRGSAHRDCNIKVKLNQKIVILFHNPK